MRNLELNSFEVQGTKIFVVNEPSLLPYIQEYIDSVNSGNPDKEGILTKYCHGELTLTLNKIELDIKPILDKLKRNKRIKDILDEGLQENEK